MIFYNNLSRFRFFFKKYILSNIFQLNNKVNFGSKDSNFFFLKELKKSKFYFEYGSGSSTLVADELNKSYISVELDNVFYNLMYNKIKKKNNIKLSNIGPVGEYSYPIFKIKSKIINYVQSIDKYSKNKNFPDLILIDGRFRVACCLNLLKFKKIIKNKTKIILDDYKNREEYHILQEFFSIKKIGRLGILKAKKNNNTNKVKFLLNKYYFISK